MKTNRFVIYLWFVLSAVTWGDVLSLQLMSYNIKHGRGMDGKLDLARTAAVIAEHEPDLLALQEVDNRCTRSENVDQAATLAKRLGMHHAFGKFMDFQGGEYGMAVLSKFPILEIHRHLLPAGAEPRCALEVIVQPPGLATPLSYIGIHHDWTKAELRVPQVEAMRKAIAHRTHPVILAGDFNGPRDDPSVRLLEEGDWTVVDKKGALTFPSAVPRVEIDFFVVRGWPGTLSDCVVVDERVASDHRPIKMSLRIGAKK